MSGDEHTQAPETEPDPAMVWRIIWGWIINPKHSNAIVAVATFFILLTNISYTVYSRLQWKAGDKAANAAASAAATASQQLTLLTQQLEATQDAVIDMGYSNKRPELDGIDEPFGPTDPKLSIWIKNSGHANARDIRVEMGVSVREISEDSRVLFHYRKDFTQPPLPPTSPGEDEPPLDFKNIIPAAYMGKINSTEATLRIEGVIRYNNGIDTAEVEEPFCYSFIRYANHGGFVQCFDFDNEVANFRKNKS